MFLLIAYDVATSQLAWVSREAASEMETSLPLGFNLALAKISEEEAKFNFPLPLPPDRYLYNPQTYSLTEKPYVIVTNISPANGTLEANGSSTYTLTYEVKDSTGTSLPWETMKVKDENKIAQVSSESIDYPTGAVKVRSFVPGVANIRLKESWNGVNTRSDGEPYVRYNRSNTELIFKSPSF